MSKVNARTVLWYLVFVGFAVNYMIRINLNITIVEMVKQHKKTSAIQNDGRRNMISECVESSAGQDDYNKINSSLNEWALCSDNSTNCGNDTILNSSREDRNSHFNHQNRAKNETKSFPIYTNSFSIERSLLSTFQIDYTKDGFQWNEYQQGLVLGSFFWLHWITQIPGGLLAKRYGTKIVFGLANAVGCWLCFLIPIVSYWNYKFLILLRVVQGLICGLAWPAMHHMTGQWIPPNERSKFVTAYLGSSIGIAVFYPLFGYVMAWSSWEWVFHVCGIFGTVWYVFWVLLVYNTPSKHPRISEKEKNYIEKSLGASIQHDMGRTPWKEILLSKAVWMNVIAQWGGIWGLFTLMTQAPTYFRIIHGWNIKMTGLLSGLPHLMRMLFAYCFSIFGDYLLRNNKMSRTNVRKMATSICCILKGVFVLALAYSGCSSLAAVIFLTLATAVHGAVSTGPLASIVDIAPNFAGIVLGISGMIGVLPGFISPVIVGILTLGNQSITSWKYVFIIASGMLIVSGILFVLFCDSALQDWNNPKKDVDKEKEMQLINSFKCYNNTNDEKVTIDTNQCDLEKSSLMEHKTNA